MILPSESPDAIPAELSEFQREEVRRLTAELARRDMEAIRIYEPTGQAAPFHKCTARERTCRGSNRAGKTLAAAMEVAMAVTGQHPHLSYPKKNGVAILVGKNDIHVATVFYKMLCRPGAFKMIRDLETGAWRAFRPWLTEDAGREDQVQPAPPLIPPRMIKGGHKGIAWEDQKKKVFKMIPLANGWEIWAHPSGGEPPQGVAVDLVWMDEHITNPEWYDEMSARLLDRHGSFIWSATPQSFNPQLLDLSQEYERLLKEGHKNPRIVEFKFLLKDNPHIDEEEQRILAEKYAGNEQAYRVRIMGEFASMGYLMYPNFYMGVHGMNRSDLPDNEVPGDWCRYMVVDPGHTKAAVLFAAVPPPGSDYGDIVLVYDELYITGCDGPMFGKAVAEKVGHQWFWEFLIDKKGAQPKSAGDGRPVEWHYEQGLKKRGVRSQQTGYGFIPGLAKVETRCEHVRNWLSRRDDGTYKLKILRDELPNFEREISRYRKNMTPKGIIEDKPAPRQADHLMNCLEYLAAHNPDWNHTKKPDKPASRAYQAFKNFTKKRDENKSGAIVFS